MRVRFIFTCRECGGDTEINWDTSGDGQVVPLTCQSRLCGHTSGEVTPEYRFRPEHRPQHEQDAAT